MDKSATRMEEDTTFRKLFIGGLSYNTSETGLRDYFLQFGAVAEANVVDSHGRSKGYGFVTFVNPEDAAITCQNRFHRIDGRTINCNLAAFPDEISQRSSRNLGPRMHFGSPAPHSSSFPVVQYPLPYTYPYWSPNYLTFGPTPMYAVPSVYPFGQPSDSNQPFTSNNNPIHGPGLMYVVPSVYPYGQASGINEPAAFNNPMQGPGSVPPVYPYGQASGSNEPANGDTPVIINITCNATENGSPMSGPPLSANSSVRQDSS